MGRFFSHLYHRHIPKQLIRGTCNVNVRSNSGESQRVLLPSEAGAASYALSEQIAKERSSPASAMSTVLSHAGLSSVGNSEAMQNQPLSPPIQLATTYERPADGDYGDGWIYSRQSNPTRKLLEDVMGQLETATTVNAFDMNSSQYDVSKTASGFAFSSGMAAISSLILAHKSHVRVLLPTDVYHGVPTQFSVVLNDHGVDHRAVDMTNFEKLHKIIDEEVANFNSSGREGSLIVWMETPSNPLCQVTDIQKICDMVSQIRSASTSDKFRITTVVDSTWAPPCITQPLKFGADVVIHSGTKYLGGHSDVLLGLVCTSPYTVEGNWLAQRVSSTQTSIGAVADPFSCWLTLRGLRTLHLRVERSCRSALEIANYLKKSHADVVVKVHYPGLPSHPQHEIAKRQMVLYGGMISFEVKNEVMAMAVAGAVRIIKRATSLGGTESLLEHRAVS